jgi:hypothetical protein
LLTACFWARLYKVAITPEDIKAVIATEGFGHEMRVRRILKSYRIVSQLQHGGGYRDPHTKKIREFDFRWIFPQGETVLSLAIECKGVALERPVIISGSKREPREARHALVESRKGGTFTTIPYFDGAAAGVIRNLPADVSIYPSGNFVGRNILQLRPGQKPGNYIAARDSEIYDKWFQALASAFDLVNEALRYAERFATPHVFTLVLPIVVLPDDTLWQAEYAENGDLLGDPVRVDQCELYIGRSITPPHEAGDITSPYTFSHLHFFTSKGFIAFLRDATGSGGENQWWRAAAFNSDVILASKAERRS